MLHPVFLDLLSSNSLLDRLATRTLSTHDAAPSATLETGPDARPIWLSEDDLSAMWKLVLKSKLHKTTSWYRIENLTWRLFFYARTRKATDPVPVAHTGRLQPSSKGGSSCGSDWSIREGANRLQSSPAIPIGVPSRPSVLPVKPATAAECKVSSKSFAAMHEFALLSLDSTSTLDGDEEYQGATNLARDAAAASKPQRRESKKKKKDVDKFLQQLDCHTPSRPPGPEEEAHITVIKASPEMKRIGIAPRRVSKGFAIPSRKSLSSTNANSPRFAFSSISSDDALNSFDTRPSIHLSSAVYRARRPSFSRSASPGCARLPVSMLTILMNGQLTTSSTSPPKTPHSGFMPPTRPSAPVHETIIEETEPETLVPAPATTTRSNLSDLLDRRRPISRRSSKSNGLSEIQAALQIW